MEELKDYTPEQIVLAIEILDCLGKANNKVYTNRQLYSLDDVIIMLLKHRKELIKNK